MKTRLLGRTGIDVSEIGYGAWAIGGAMWGGPRDEDSKRALAHALTAGVTFFDTALVYGDGHSEKLVGELLRSHKHRGLSVATKVMPKTMRWPAGRGAKVNDVFPRDWIVSCCERSLRNLNLEVIDLLQLHVWEDPWADTDDWYEAMLKLQQQGKIRFFGVSVNDHEPESVLRLVKSGRVDSVQVIYNVFDQSPEDELLPACKEANVGVIARVPLDEGSLTGKLTPDTTFPEGDFRRRYFGGPRLKETIERVEKVRPLLEEPQEGERQSMARGALRFCLSHPAVSTVIPGMRSQAHVDDNTSASAGGPLLATTLEALRPHRWVRKNG